MKLNVIQFIREVRREMDRVTWPTRKEITVTAFMVLLMTLVFALFFMFSDFLISNLIFFIFDFGSISL